MLLNQSNLINCCRLYARPVITLATRNFDPKGRQPQDDGIYRGGSARRWGFAAHHHERGLLPRLSIKEKRIPTMPITIKEDVWSLRRANMGRNDLIRILGDESVQQHDLLTHIPDWLRGYKNTSNEYSVLQRKRREFSHWRYTKPLKWLHLEQRIKFLYRRINNKYQPPDVELLYKSRHNH